MSLTQSLGENGVDGTLEYGPCDLFLREGVNISQVMVAKSGHMNGSRSWIISLVTTANFGYHTKTC